MKNKWLAGLFLVVVVLSLLPLASAKMEGAEGKEKVTTMTEGKTAAVQDIKEEIKQLKEQEKEIKTEAKEKIKEIRKSKEELRTQAKERIKEVKDKIEQVKEQYKTLKDDYKSKKEEYQQERESLKETKEKAGCKEDTDECKGKKIEHQKGVRQHLLNTNAMITKSLEKLLNQVETSPVLTDAEKEEALTSLNQVKEKIIAEQQKLETMGENASNAELKAGIKELKELWIEVKKEEKKMIVLLINSRLGNSVEKHQEYANAMQMRIENLEKENIDATELKNLLNKFNESTVDLKENYAEAKKAWERSTGSNDELILKETKGAQDKVKDELKKTKALLRDFLSKYKELKPKAGKETAPVTIPA